ncbi:hypothetical protein [Methylobacterium sp. 174MFSha1.1]|uniref:hypothetical protein n=1 Tax=Methylobacterium sp. 174MFSha1.1 TaxID=1502749 RepID=UPI001160D6B9|nr:hypothetical protein [Methylobacterium sp. 174MFSha1.1]
MTGLVPEAFEISNRLFPRFRKWLNDKFPEKSRRRFEVYIVALAVFVAGFLAWRDERNAKSDIESRYNDLVSKSQTSTSLGSRLVLYEIEPVVEDNAYIYRVKVINNGNIAAYILNREAVLIVSEQGPFLNGSTPIIKGIEERILQGKYQIDTDIELQPNRYQSFEFKSSSSGATLVENKAEYEAIVNRSKYLHLMMVMSYKDDALLFPNQRRIVKICASFIGGFSNRYACPGQNRSYLSNE